MKALEEEFLTLIQGGMIVAESIRKFERLARVFPNLVPTEEQRAQHMLEMFRSLV